MLELDGKQTVNFKFGLNNPQDNPCYDCHQNNLSNSNKKRSRANKEGPFDYFLGIRHHKNAKSLVKSNKIN